MNPQSELHVMKKYVAPTDDEIACCAFSIIARELPHLARAKWREAEMHLIADRKHDAGLLQKRRQSDAQTTLYAA